MSTNCLMSGKWSGPWLDPHSVIYWAVCCGIGLYVPYLVDIVTLVIFCTKTYILTSHLIPFKWKWYGGKVKFSNWKISDDHQLLPCLANMMKHRSIWPDIHIIFFLYLHENVSCGYSLEVPHWGTLMSTHNICFLWRNKENINTFQMKKSAFCGAMI